MYDYAIRFEREKGQGMAVFCRDLPELNSYGDDRDHAIRDAMDAIETTLSLYVEQRRKIPQATPPEPGEHVIRLPTVTVAKIVLWNEMVARRMRKADLCRLLEIAQTQGDRLVDFLHATKMDALEAALEKLDISLAVKAIDPNAVAVEFYPGFNKKGHRTILIRRRDTPFSAIPEDLVEAYKDIHPQHEYVNLNDLSSRWWLTKKDGEALLKKGWSAFSMVPMATQSRL
ncbi:type II toxin-antitoxin system HicB family antitoxin [Phytopseudomonas daroniae]|uniref:type II toxin-antitoxin system HicB family antitoxin n=1 Tax=Phytopseudomonas daroniae TaxID=2487519 RepID=UPI001FC9E739|nr:type II toxin-antitoxin system HicB family antitoxin [Pseudomonas daroniae]